MTPLPDKLRYLHETVNTPDTERHELGIEHSTGANSTHLLKTTPDTENANYMQVIECKCECHKSNLQLCSMCCHHHGYIWHEEHKRAISSRDTYWKERVDRAFVILDTNIQELVTYEERRVSKESVLTCVRRIKRELDNLK